MRSAPRSSGEVVAPAPGQAGLFGQGHEPEDEADGGWGVTDDESVVGEYAEATLVGDDEEPDAGIGTETAPIATIDELMGDVESPDEGAVERAAEYFAPYGSWGRRERGARAGRRRLRRRGVGRRVLRCRQKSAAR